MDLSAQNAAYLSYVQQGKEAYDRKDFKKAYSLLTEAAKITNELSLKSTSIKIKTQFHEITREILDFRNKCTLEQKQTVVNNNMPNSGVVDSVKITRPIEGDISLEDALQELNSLIGLYEVKKTVRDWANQIEVFQIREKMGLKVPKMTYHMVFTGNPGTGKTTVAKIVGKISRALGIVKEGHLVEADRSKLVALHVGGTAKQTNAIIEKARGGVLFVDEAYTLAQGGESDFGPEAIATLLLGMENYRNELVVIVAGYEELMSEFIDSNPGLKSRFKTFINFTDYNGEQLLSIFMLECKKNDYIISEDLKIYLINYFNKLYSDRDENFGNGRDVRNIFEKIVTNQSRRISKKFAVCQPTREEMMLLTIEDLD